LGATEPNGINRIAKLAMVTVSEGGETTFQPFNNEKGTVAFFNKCRSIVCVFMMSHLVTEKYNQY
jgi:hypothetical protein